MIWYVGHIKHPRRAFGQENATQRYRLAQEQRWKTGYG